MEWYRPGAVVLQCGADSLAGDRLGCFNLSHKGHNACVEFVRRFNLPTLVLGGGGYTIRNVARCWAYETATVVQQLVADELPFNDYFDYYGPDYSISVPSTNMPNLNTSEYLQKCTATIMENLKRVQFAPSVQAHVVPPDAFSSGDESGEEEDERLEFDPFDLWALKRRSRDEEEVGATYRAPSAFMNQANNELSQQFGEIGVHDSDEDE